MVKGFLKKYLIVLVACFLIGFAIHRFASVIIEDIFTNALKDIARQGTKIVKNDLEAHMNILSTISQNKDICNPQIPLGDRVKILRNYTTLDKFLRLALADVDGVLATTDGFVIDVKDRKHFQQAMMGENTITDPITSKIDNSRILVFAVPLYYDGKISGMLNATYPASELNDMIAHIHYAEKGYAYLLDKEGNTIAHPDLSLVENNVNHIQLAQHDKSLKALQALEQNMIQGKSGAGRYYFNGKEKYMGYAPISGTEWSLAITATKDEVFSEINGLLTFIVMLAIIVSVSILLVNTYLVYLKKRINQHRRASQNAVDIARMLVISFAKDGTITAFNRFAEEKTGYAKEELIGLKSIYDLVDEDSVEKLRSMCSNRKNLMSKGDFELTLNSSEGEKRYILFNITRSEQSYIKNMLQEEIEMIGFDLTDRLKAQKVLKEKHEELTQVYEELSASQDELHTQFEKIYQLAYYDTLTKLPNRAQFQQHLSASLQKQSGCIVIFIIDIDNFKYINDTFGYHYGNVIIREMAQKLVKLAEGRFLVARLSGDEFAAIIEQPQFNEAELVSICNSIFSELEKPFSIDHIKLNLSVSIGISANTVETTDGDTLLSYADAAMNKAKERGKNGFVFFDKSMTREMSDKLIVTNYLRNAVSNSEFKLFYQPKYHVQTQKICGFEGLLRWNNPQLGNVPPSEFIKIAEESGLIQSIGLWVLKEGCLFSKRINANRGDNLIVSINVSPIQLIQDNFVDQVIKVLQETEANPMHIGIEITESAMLDAFESCLNKLDSLHKMGIRIYLDDFGTGYSSLNYLSKLPISIIKLDRSFIKEIETDNKVFQLTETIISLSHKIGMDTVAEGVETIEQLDILKKFGCDMVQGYLFSKPVPEESAILLLS